LKQLSFEGSGRIKLRHCSNVHVAAEVTARRIASAPSGSTQQGTAPANAAGVDDALAASASITLGGIRALHRRDQPVVVATCDSAEATSPLSALKRRMSNDDVLALPPASAGGDFVFSIARNAARECGAAPSKSHGKLHREVAG
jgi:hypothetical protein